MRTAILPILALLACTPITSEPEPEPGSTSDDASSTGEQGSTGAVDGSSSGGESSTGEPPDACILPTSGSWCSAAQEAGTAIGCQDPDCWATVAAQYGGDPAMLPDCEEPAAACSTEGLADCVAQASAAGLTQARAVPTCLALVELYGVLSCSVDQTEAGSFGCWCDDLEGQEYGAAPLYCGCEPALLNGQRACECGGDLYLGEWC